MKSTQLDMFGFPEAPKDKPPEVDQVKRLRDMQKMSLVQVAPNVWRHSGNGSPPEMVICRVIPSKDDTVRLVPAFEHWMRLCSVNVKLLGMEGQWHTLMRLGRAGFIEIANPAPRLHMLNLTTWWGHLARVAENPDFWDQHTESGRERMKLYKENMF